MTSVSRVVLAGGQAKPELAALIGTTNRALAMFQGRTLLACVVDALREADAAAPVCVVGSVPETEAYTRLEDQGDFVSNLMIGVKHYADHDWTLIASADMPFLTGAVVAEFTRAALELGNGSSANLIYPIVPVAECYARFPGVRRTAVRLYEGTFTGGNVMLARPSFLLKQQDLIARFYAARKEPVRLASMLGFDTILRLLLAQAAMPGFLRLSFLEQKVGALVGGPVRALVCLDAELATDLDRPSDFAAVSGSASHIPAGHP